MSRVRWYLVAALAALMIVAACGGGGDGDDAGSDDPAEDARDTGGEARDAGGEDADASGVADDEAPSSTVVIESSLPADRPLDEQASHPNGTQVILRGIAFREDRIQVDFSATNGRDRDVELHSFSDDDTFLEDDLGNRYFVSPPPQNPELRIAPRATIEGTLVFLGRVHPDARSLRLVFNNGIGGDSRHSSHPKMAFEGIDVSGRGDSAATGSDGDDTTTSSSSSTSSGDAQ